MREEHLLTAGRWKLQFIEEQRPLSIPFRQREEAVRAASTEPSVGTLVLASESLARRGTGGTVWVPFREDPIAFVLHTTSDGGTLCSLAGIRIVPPRQRKLESTSQTENINERSNS